MQKRLFKVVGVVVAGMLLVKSAAAMDRDADSIISIGGGGGKVDKYTRYSGGVAGEFAVSQDKTWSFVAGAEFSKIDTDGNQTGQSLTLGMKKYLFPETTLAIFAGVFHNHFGEDETVSAATRYEAIAMKFDYDVDVFGVGAGLSLKQRFLPATEVVSPFINAGASFSKGWTDVAGDVELYYENYRGWLYARADADDVVEYEYDPNLDLSVGFGVDITPAQQKVGLCLGADIGYTLAGGSVKIGDKKYDFDKDNYSWWQVSGALKFYL